MFHVGSFGEAGAQTDQYVEWLREYCQTFFCGLSVKLLPAVTVAETGCSFRVNFSSHNLQILTGKLRSPSLLLNALFYHICCCFFAYTPCRNARGGKMQWSPTGLCFGIIVFSWNVGDLLQFLSNRKPKDAFCIVGITMIDLYPEDSWNFVFGEASLSMGEILPQSLY